MNTNTRRPGFVTGTGAMALFILTLGGAPSPAFSQDWTDPGGIAFVEAPEQGGGVCFGKNAAEGFQCAMDQCLESGAYAEDCYEIKWCYPSGWAADIFKQHREGNHWHDYLCGWDSEADLDAAIKIACEGSSAEYLIECSAVYKWSPDGTRIDLF